MALLGPEIEVLRNSSRATGATPPECTSPTTDGSFLMSPNRNQNQSGLELLRTNRSVWQGFRAFLTRPQQGSAQLVPSSRQIGVAGKTSAKYLVVDMSRRRAV